MNKSMIRMIRKCEMQAATINARNRAKAAASSAARAQAWATNQAKTSAILKVSFELAKQASM